MVREEGFPATVDPWWDVTTLTSLRVHVKMVLQLRKLIESALTTGVTPLLIKAINVVVMGLIGVLLYQVSQRVLPPPPCGSRVHALRIDHRRHAQQNTQYSCPCVRVGCRVYAGLGESAKTSPSAPTPPHAPTHTYNPRDCSADRIGYQ